MGSLVVFMTPFFTFVPACCIPWTQAAAACAAFAPAIESISLHIFGAKVCRQTPETSDVKSKNSNRDPPMTAGVIGDCGHSRAYKHAIKSQSADIEDLDQTENQEAEVAHR